MKRAKLKAALTKQFYKGLSKGENNYINLLKQAKKDHRQQISNMHTEHTVQLKNQDTDYHKSVSLIEKQYAGKLNILDKKIKRMDVLVKEWENKVTMIRTLSAQTKEINAEAQQKMYQQKQVLAAVIDDAKSQDAIDAKLANALNKTTMKDSDLDVSGLIKVNA